VSTCEKCWADASADAHHRGGTTTDHYHRLLKERAESPCTPEEQAGQFWDAKHRCDLRIYTPPSHTNPNNGGDEMQGPGGQTAVDVPPARDPIEELFTYHKPSPEQEEQYKEIRSAAKALVRVIDRVCPPGPDRTTAVRKIRESVMTANASIATGNAKYS
jgi:hypothetical protein